MWFLAVAPNPPPHIPSRYLEVVDFPSVVCGGGGCSPKCEIGWPQGSQQNTYRTRNHIHTQILIKASRLSANTNNTATHTTVEKLADKRRVCSIRISTLQKEPLDAKERRRVTDVCL